MVGDEFGAVARGDFGMFEAALPFVDGPSRKIIFGEAREHAFEVDLAVTERPVACCALSGCGSSPPIRPKPKRYRSDARGKFL